MAYRTSQKTVWVIVIITLFAMAAFITGCGGVYPGQESIKDTTSIPATSISADSGTLTEPEAKEDESISPPPVRANNAAEANIEIISFESDKKDYSSQEDIHFSAKIISSDEVKGVTFIVKGIKPYNHDYISVAKTDELAKGENKASFSAKTPYCTSGCGGVYPGEYWITLEIFLGDELLASKSLSINLRS